MSKPPPPPEQASRFEPLPLGSNAFAPPVITGPSSEDEPSRLRKAMPWLVLTGVAAISGLAVWIAVVVNQPASKEDTKPEREEVAAAELEPSAAEGEHAAQAAAEPGAEANAAQAAAMPLPNPPTAPEAQAAAPAAEANAASAPGEEGAGDERNPAESDAAREKRHAARAAKAAAAAAAAAASSKQLPAAPSRTDVLETMARVQPAVARCMEGAHGIVTADMKILNTGKVASANISGAPGTAGSCIAGAVRKARFPEFSTPSIAVRYPMKL